MLCMGAGRRAFIHFGLQKTGTSFLQHVLFQSTEALAAQGLDMVPGDRLAAFRLMLRVRHRYDPAIDPPGVADALKRFQEQLEAAPGTRALLTEESLAPAMKREIAPLLEACASREVHLVITVRDLARQIPSAWQEWVKGSMNLPFEEYVESLYEREVPASRKFWAHQDLTRTMGRWALFVPPERIHVVTVPQRGANPQVLLDRFCQVIQVEPGSLDLNAPLRNDSLGHVQAELLRRVNEALAPELRRRDIHGAVGKRYFAGQILRRQEGAPARLHARHRPWCDELAHGFVAELRAGGYRVVGDLEELIPADTSYTEDAEPVDDTAVARSAAEALAAILADEAERRLAARTRRAANDQLRQGGRASGLHRRLARGLRLWVRRRVRRSS
jgi:hypothetical protein